MNSATRDVNDMIRDVAMEAATKAITEGALDAELEALVTKFIREGRDKGLTEIGFVLKMAVYILDHGCPTFSEAKRRASMAYKEFRRDNAVKFGDPQWDWTGAGARDVAREYETAYY